MTTFRITDGNAVETAESFTGAVSLIRSWYSDGFDDATRDAWEEAVERTAPPAPGDDLHAYARTLCDTAASIEGIDEVVGIADYGGTTYRVSAADRAGFTLNVTEVTL